MPLTEQELHNLAMNIVGEALQELGWEFLLVNSDRKKNPQFVCVDPQGQKSFIIVRPILQGDDPDVYDPVLMETVSRTLSKFHHDGLIKVEHKHIKILEPQALKKMVSGCTHAM